MGREVKKSLPPCCLELGNLKKRFVSVVCTAYDFLIGKLKVSEPVIKLIDLPHIFNYSHLQIVTGNSSVSSGPSCPDWIYDHLKTNSCLPCPNITIVTFGTINNGVQEKELRTLMMLLNSIKC